MKIITWNCNGAFRKKHHLLDELNADLVIIQECENPSLIGGEYANWARNYCWIGENKNRGVGVFVRGDISLEKLDWENDGLQLFLPCRIADFFTLVAVWTKQANSPNFQYIGQLWKYLQLHRDKIAADNALICGDFNSNTQWDEWDRWWNHSDVVRELKEINIHSIYHELTGEQQGKETKPTLFMQRKIQRPYHIDYAFASRRLFDRKCSLEIGCQEKWIAHSDHMPVIFTINMDPRLRGD